MSILKVLFHSKEHKQLSEAMTGLAATISQQGDIGPDLEKIIELHNDKSVRGIEALPTTTDADRALLDMVKHTQEARNHVHKHEEKFLSSFDNVLAYRNPYVHPTVFQVSNFLSRQLAQANQKDGPDTLVQTKALDRLQQHYFLYSDHFGGPREGGVGYSNFEVGLTVALRAARGYKAHNVSQESARVYGEINQRVTKYDIPLKDPIREEVNAGMPSFTQQKPAYKIG